MSEIEQTNERTNERTNAVMCQLKFNIRLMYILTNNQK